MMTDTTEIKDSFQKHTPQKPDSDERENMNRPITRRETDLGINNLSVKIGVKPDGPMGEFCKRLKN
jgi:hypothetical protein